MAELLPCIGFQHTPSLARFSPNRKTLRPLGPFVVQSRVRTPRVCHVSLQLSQLEDSCSLKPCLAFAQLLGHPHERALATSMPEHVVFTRPTERWIQIGQRSSVTVLFDQRLHL